MTWCRYQISKSPGVSRSNEPDHMILPESSRSEAFIKFSLSNKSYIINRYQGSFPNTKSASPKHFSNCLVVLQKMKFLLK